MPLSVMSALEEKRTSWGRYVIEASVWFFPNYFSALIYIKAKPQKTARLHCTERGNQALKTPCTLLNKLGRAAPHPPNPPAAQPE